MSEVKYKFKYRCSQDADDIPLRDFLECSSVDHAEACIKELKEECGYDTFTEIVPYQIVEFDSEKITRIEFIGKNGREFVKYLDRVEIQIQDGGRTMKIFQK